MNAHQIMDSIESRRLALGISTRYLAKVGNITMVTYRNWRDGRHPAKYDTLMKMLDAIDSAEAKVRPTGDANG